MSVSLTKALIVELSALALRVKALERANSANGAVPAEIKMDKDTQAMFDRLMAAVEAKAPVATSEDTKQEAKAAAIKVLTPKANPKAPTQEQNLEEFIAKATRERDKYDDMPKEDLMRRVNLRGGNATKIMAPFHARGRTNALKDWLRANPPKAKTAVAGKKPATRAAAH